MGLYTSIDKEVKIDCSPVRVVDVWVSKTSNNRDVSIGKAVRRIKVNITVGEGINGVWWGIRIPLINVGDGNGQTFMGLVARPIMNDKSEGIQTKKVRWVIILHLGAILDDGLAVWTVFDRLCKGTEVQIHIIFLRCRKVVLLVHKGVFREVLS